MATNIDPNRVKYPPEGLVDIEIEDLTASPTVIAEYSTTGQLLMSITRMSMLEETANAQLLLGVDGRAESMRVDGVATNIDTALYQNMIARYSATLYARTTTGTANNVPIGWSMLVRQPTIVDKIRMSMPLTADEREIADRLALEDMISLGLVPYPTPLLSTDDVMTRFAHIEEMSYPLGTLGASTVTQIGPTINVPLEHVYVLLGVYLRIATGGTWPWATSSPDDTFVVVNRDQDMEYMRLDAAGLASGRIVRMYVPFTQRLSVMIDTTSGSGSEAIYAGLIIGKRPATVIDHIRWGSNMPYGNAVERENINELIKRYEEKGLVDRIKAGII